ncbi:MAG: membrane protein insertion efficiency factor YidD [Candidatus Omnitrophica bacterium]|nr:membrane protein insertion efficiency factor YidD [Candidatus Omnitrophota bacterium]MBU4242602.1 membrane protein insertion efficiency factor YidD [Nanoarchaeota archaeon]
MADVLVYAIRVYQKYVSRFFRGSCIYIPSCSQYSIDAIQKHGALKGTLLAIRRILRCRPPYKGGLDPVE